MPAVYRGLQVEVINDLSEFRVLPELATLLVYRVIPLLILFCELFNQAFSCFWRTISAISRSIC